MGPQRCGPRVVAEVPAFGRENSRSPNFEVERAKAKLLSAPEIQITERHGALMTPFACTAMFPCGLSTSGDLARSVEDLAADVASPGHRDLISLRAIGADIVGQGATVGFDYSDEVDPLAHEARGIATAASAGLDQNVGGIEGYDGTQQAASLTTGGLAASRRAASASRTTSPGRLPSASATFCRTAEVPGAARNWICSGKRDIGAFLAVR